MTPDDGTGLLITNYRSHLHIDNTTEVIVLKDLRFSDLMFRNENLNFLIIVTVILTFPVFFFFFQQIYVEFVGISFFFQINIY